MPAGDPIVNLHVGDRLTLTKRHPCGSHAWRVTRTGADIGLQCEGCARRVMLDRRELERRLAGPVERPASEPADE
jgi:hypothetical protein